MSVMVVVATSLFLPVATPAADAAATTTYRRVGYLSRAAGSFTVRDLVQKGSAAQLTNLQYAFAGVSSTGECLAVPDDYQRLLPATDTLDGAADQPGQALAGTFNQIKKLKAVYRLRTSISIGGGSGSANFTTAAATAESREKFVASCIDLYIKGNLPQATPGAGAGVFDGIDIDWEYPGSVDAADKTNFTLLLKEFRRQLDQIYAATGDYLLLTAALGGSKSIVAQAYELPKIFTYLDWALVMAYDMHNARETPHKTNHQAALHPNTAAGSNVTRRDVDLYLDNFVTTGVAPNRLVLGVPFYSRGWKGVTDAGNGLFQTAAVITEPAPLDYRTVKSLRDSGYQRYWDPIAAAAWLFDGSTFWTFDDAETMSVKAAYVKAHTLGGIGVWALSGDDEQGTLLSAIDTGLR
ncbi:glycoside hydrolase family 18 protein [Actinoplanes sp. NPDC020271]|uniref:glycoside hydrolase family 18 protein n=1 Tax=Actinoplanes sp. NPDC020271 TaxID=3363896 RepID=UPI0037A5C06A